MEYALFFCLSLAAVLSVLPRPVSRSWAFGASLAAVGLVVIDIASGNWRWPLAPAVALSLLLLATTYWQVRHQQTRSARSVWAKLRLAIGIVLGAAWLAIAILLPISFPMFESPQPSGSYGVGVMDFHLVDESREEAMTERVGDPRELMVRAWYPADVPVGAAPEPFLRDVAPFHAIVSRAIAWPALMLEHLTRIDSHSYLRAPISEARQAGARFPVLVFSHGNGFYAGQNGLLMEHLASHGYVVFSIDHPYQASVVEFPDGRVALYKEEWWDAVATGLSQEAMMEAGRSYARALQAGDYDQYRALMSKFLDSLVGLNTGLQIWLDDTSFLLDELAAVDTPAGLQTAPGTDRALDVFRARLDLQRIGVFGMSYGGATAGQFCARDERCKAGINMDGMQLGDGAIDIRLKRPFMLMNADTRGFDADDGVASEGSRERHPLPKFGMNDFVYHQAREAYSMSIAGASHANFSDFGIMTAGISRWTGMLGDIDGGAMKDVLNEYTLAFFNEHLLGQTQPLLDPQAPKRAEVLVFSRRDARVAPVDESAIQPATP